MDIEKIEHENICCSNRCAGQASLRVSFAYLGLVYLGGEHDTGFA